jgi:hypothetical protein
MGVEIEILEKHEELRRRILSALTGLVDACREHAILAERAEAVGIGLHYPCFHCGKEIGDHHDPLAAQMLQSLAGNPRSGSVDDQITKVLEFWGRTREESFRSLENWSGNCCGSPWQVEEAARKKEAGE